MSYIIIYTTGFVVSYRDIVCATPSKPLNTESISVKKIANIDFYHYQTYYMAVRFHSGLPLKMVYFSIVNYSRVDYLDMAQNNENVRMFFMHQNEAIFMYTANFSYNQ